MEEMDTLAAKLDLLIKRLDKHGAIKGATIGTIQSLYSHIPYEMCGDFGHSGNDCLETKNLIMNLASNNKFFENINSNSKAITFSFTN